MLCESKLDLTERWYSELDTVSPLVRETEKHINSQKPIFFVFYSWRAVTF